MGACFLWSHRAPCSPSVLLLKAWETHECQCGIEGPWCVLEWLWGGVGAVHQTAPWALLLQEPKNGERTNQQLSDKQLGHVITINWWWPQFWWLKSKQLNNQRKLLSCGCNEFPGGCTQPLLLSLRVTALRDEFFTKWRNNSIRNWNYIPERSSAASSPISNSGSCHALHIAQW